MSDSDSDDDLLTSAYNPSAASKRTANTKPSAPASTLFKSLTDAAGESLDIKAASKKLTVRDEGVGMDEIEKLESKGRDINERRKRDREEAEKQDEEVKQRPGRNFGSSEEDTDLDSIETLEEVVKAARGRNVQSGMGKMR